MATVLPAQAWATDLRQPSNQWTVDFDESQCVAYRNYGTAEKPFMLALKAPPLGELMELVFIRPGWGSELAEEFEVKLNVDGRPYRTSMIAYALRKKGQRVSRITLNRDVLASLASARGLSVNASSARFNEGFALRGMGRLLKVMEDCVADLRQVWNVPGGDGALSPQLRAGAIGSLAGLIKHTDYPDSAIRALKGGSVQVALLINERGRVADCTLIETSGVPTLDTQTCALIKARARYQPAIGVDGKPAKHAALQRVTWRVE